MTIDFTPELRQMAIEASVRIAMVRSISHRRMEAADGTKGAIMLLALRRRELECRRRRSDTGYVSRPVTRPTILQLRRWRGPT
jgi:hypothetical protein